MLKFRTSKELQTSLHDTNTSIIEFQFVYSRSEDGMKVICNAYEVHVDENSYETLELIPAGGSTRLLTLEELNAMLEQVVAMTTANDNPIEYMDALIASGIKLIIVSEGLWKSQLTLEDFE